MSPRTTYTREELLASHRDLEPLIADGRRCHGGFDGDGRYVSPRTLHRSPAIDAWQAAHVSASPRGLIEAPVDRWPESFPNVAQSQLLLRHGVRDPFVSSLTRIGTVEGFGAFLRHTTVPDLQRCFDDDLTGTATAHLSEGLIEAHARDEAGHDGVAGHNEMWFAARDIAFESPATVDETALMLERMGIVDRAGRPGTIAMPPQRRLPDAFDPDLELLIERMVRLMMIEVQAFHTFAWAEALLADTDLVAGDGEAARLVSHIRADETPHVEYLRTSLSEMRDRSIRLDDGTTVPGADAVAAIWEPALADSLGARRAEAITVMGREIEHAVASRSDADDLLDELSSLGTVRRRAPGAWVDITLAA